MQADDKIRLETKIDKIADKIGSIDSTLAAQHVSLEEHMRRTEINEEAILTLSKELKPVFNQYTIVSFLGKLSLLGLGGGGLYHLARALISLH